MKIQWDNSLNTGNSLIDGQHQELYRRVDALMVACREGAAIEAVQPTIRFIEEYMDEHFATEEKLLIEHNLPDAEAHIAEHREFCSQVDRIVKLFATHGADYSLAIDTINTVIGWVGLHIHGRDQSLCRFLQEQNVIKEQPDKIVHPLDLSK